MVFVKINRKEGLMKDSISHSKKAKQERKTKQPKRNSNKIKITEEMRFRQKVVKYAIKHSNNAKAARRYHTSRQQVSRWRNKYNGSIESLANKSRKPKSHPNQHTEKELKLIEQKHKRYKHEGLAQVYRKLTDAGYARSYESMCKQLKKLKLDPQPKEVRYPKSNYQKLVASTIGEYVQVDVKFVPNQCIKFRSNYSRYYQITAIDLFSRKRVLMLVNENSTYTTSQFLNSLEQKMGFKIKVVQTDNGKEFCNDKEVKDSLFQKRLKELGIEHKRTRPYSPWQNGTVERSHRIDNQQFYSRRIFKTEEQLYKSFNRYATRTNNVARKILKFKTPNEIVEKMLKLNQQLNLNPISVI